MEILKQIMKPPSGVPWVSPKMDCYWFAAGLTLEAFEIISVTAVAMIAFRDSGLVVSFFADAIAQMPPHVKDPDLMIIYVEIGLMAEMNFADGYFTIAASIAPTSFLLVSACRLYGGFAMTYWFDVSIWPDTKFPADILCSLMSTRVTGYSQWVATILSTSLQRGILDLSVWASHL